MRNKCKKNRYIMLRLKIMLSAIARGRVSFKKIYNAFYCFLSYHLRLRKSARYPFMINFELTNRCNMNCCFCRTENGDIYDQNPEGGMPIPEGDMPFELFTNIIDEVRGYILIAVLYVNGEPLMCRDLCRAISYASERDIATMIATNGQLLNERKTRELLDAGLVFIKIAISGFTQKIYNIQHRNGDIERVKENIRTLSHYNRKGKYGLLIMVDYMSYEYNTHELDAARRFCDELGVMFNARPGNLRGLEDKSSLPQSEDIRPADTLCTWLWKVLTVNWNGDILPCCDYVIWSRGRPYTRFEIGKSVISDIWNGREVIKNRMIHVRKGREAIPVCSKCQRQGTAFKY